MNLDDVSTAASFLTRPAEEFGNDSGIEKLWAIKAYDYAEVYFNILCSVDPTALRLTPHDDSIYEEFRSKFPAFVISIVDEEALKSSEAKEQWRIFCNSFQHVEDFNLGTLVRLDSCKDYTEENTILVTRIQFYAIEISRNREGLNNEIRHNFPRKPLERS